LIVRTWRRCELRIECPRRRNKLPKQAWRDRTDRIDRDPWRAGRADRFIVDAEQTFLIAAAKEQADDRYLPEHIVETVEWNERAAEVYVVSHVINVSFDGRADQGAAHDPVANGHFPGKARKLGAHFAEVDAGASGATG